MAAGGLSTLGRNLGAGLVSLWLRPGSPERLSATPRQLLLLGAVVAFAQGFSDWLYAMPGGEFQPWSLRGLGLEFLLLLGLGVVVSGRGGDAAVPVPSPVLNPVLNPILIPALAWLAIQPWMALLDGVAFAGLRLVGESEPRVQQQLAVALNAWQALATALAALHWGGFRRLERAVVTLGIAGLFAFSALVPRDSLFWPAEEPGDQPGLTGAGQPSVASEAVLERQAELFQQALAGLEAQRPGVVDAYFLGFAPYADEDVFRIESETIRALMDQRFDTRERSLLLVNHRQTLDQLPLASAAHLRKSLIALGQTIDPSEDLVILYLTSHGSRDHRLIASFPPLEFEEVTPQRLRSWLDEAGIRYRVVAVSACYSGGYLPALEGPDTLVMTAASADRTSFGCGSASTFTYFGKALFDEQLRLSTSFEEAFQAALPVLREREEAAGHPFSEPQISVGEGITPVLDRYRMRLEPAAP